MNAPLLSIIDRELLNDLTKYPATPGALERLKKIQFDYVNMDYVAEMSIPAGGMVQKQVKLEQGYYFFATGIAVSHDQPDAPPVVQVTDLKRQRDLLPPGGVVSSVSFGPGASKIMTEPGHVVYPFKELGLALFTVKNPAATALECTVILSGWKIPMGEF